MIARFRLAAIVKLTLLNLAAGHVSSVHAASVSRLPVYSVHGSPRSCSSITQLDSALASGYQPFFAQWNEKDYADATAWAEACSSYGWHVPERPRIESLRRQHDRALGPTSQVAAPLTAQVKAIPVLALQPSIQVTSRPRIKWGAVQALPADGSDVVGFDATITSHYQDTLPDIARRYGLGYEEIRQANPAVDVWLPGEGTRIRLPGRHHLPPGPRKGLVINLAEYRLYYFPDATTTNTPQVLTYPVSIGKLGEGSPLGQSVVTAKVEHPTWHPPASVRKEHSARGEPLPEVVAPGPDNPLGDFMLRLNVGGGAYEIHGTNNPRSVGMASTNGCIGMYPEDIETLFKLVSLGTPVRIVNQRL